MSTWCVVRYGLRTCAECKCHLPKVPGLTRLQANERSSCCALHRSVSEAESAANVYVVNLSAHSLYGRWGADGNAVCLHTSTLCDRVDRVCAWE